MKPPYPPRRSRIRGVGRTGPSRHWSADCSWMGSFFATVPRPVTTALMRDSLPERFHRRQEKQTGVKFSRTVRLNELPSCGSKSIFIGERSGARSASAFGMDESTQDFGSTSARANRALQDNVDRNEPRIVASYGLIGAILLFGAIGFTIDRWADTSPWALVVGLATGMLLGFFQLLRAVRHP
jgi:hypothetical protein